MRQGKQMNLDMKETFDIIRILAALGLLSLASMSDWKTRTAEDWIWAAMGALGLVLLLATMLAESWPPTMYAGLALLFIVFIDIFLDRKPIYDSETGEVGKTGAAMLLLCAGLLSVVLLSDSSVAHKGMLLGPVFMIYFFYALYMVNVVHGGADAKALMVLSILFPLHPNIPGIPLFTMPAGSAGDMLFPFSFLVLFYAAISTLAVPVALLARNAFKGDLSLPEAFLGYRKDISGDPGFCWPMEIVEKGDIILRYRPAKGADVEAQFNALMSRGRSVVWVTPKIPFLIPMVVGLVLAVALGNPFALLLQP